ncbi:CDP-glycerol--glycerophosphate glycerophosphotransferase, partial [Staphylococcus pseudintermedius]|nr:CDP-glycerol--glycerophosphate glycerophosphotransferase [Staphylococcus pseudintermedius]
TFRDDEVSKSKKHIINLKMDLNKMKDQLGQEYILLLRPHIIISNAIYIEEHLKHFVVNVADYNEISDLYLITDICITDYSSIMFDFANTRKPLLFFTYDYEHYKEHLRGFYFDFKEMSPGPLLYNDNELINAIKNIDNINRTYANKYSAFYNEFCTFENGTSAQTIINRFFNVK